MTSRVDTGDFFFRGGAADVGCLLLHGFSGTPHEMRFLGERLRAEEYAVRGVRLPGHATLGPTLYEAGWRDWYAEALHGLEDLARLSSSVVVIGLSMGSLLALRLAAERADLVRRVAVLAPALVLGDTRLGRLGPVLRVAAPLLPRRLAARRKRGSDIADEEARRVHPSFPIPLRGMAELGALQQSVRVLLGRVTQPVLILHGRLDRTCPLDNVEILRRELGSRQVQSRIFDKSAHILTVDAEKTEVAAEVLRFVAPAAVSATGGSL